MDRLRLITVMLLGLTITLAGCSGEDGQPSAGSIAVPADLAQAQATLPAPPAKGAKAKFGQIAAKPRAQR